VPTGKFMEAAIAATGYGAYYEGAQAFYAGYKAVYTIYDTYKYWYPDVVKAIDDNISPKGQFVPGGSLTVAPKRYVRRRRYRRRY